MKFEFNRRPFRTHGKLAGRSSRRSRPAVELLEARVTPSGAQTLTTLNFNLPADVAGKGVQIGLYGNTSNLKGASEDYLAGTPTAGYSFQPVPAPPGPLPLITLASAGSYNQPQTFHLPIPAGQPIFSGELFIFVGQVDTGLAITKDASSGMYTVAAPKAMPDPANNIVPDNFAQFEFTYDGTNLDIDTSAVDSTGYPFSLVYPSAVAGFPLNPLGITLDQKDLTVNFEHAFNPGGAYAQYPQFKQSGQFNSQQLVAPQDILAEETGAPPVLASATSNGDASSHLAAGANYYYLITAYSSNVIPNSGGVLGETLASNIESVTNLPAASGVQLAWTPYNDPNTAGYNVYRYSTNSNAGPTSSTAYTLIAHLAGESTTGYTDEGAIPQAQQIVPSTASNYGFNPLSYYETANLQSFFAHYTTPNSFRLNRDGALWVGNTITYAPTASWNNTTVAASFAARSSTITLNFPQLGGNTTAGDEVLSLTSGSTSVLVVGMYVAGPGILPGTIISSIVDSTTLDLSNGATLTGSGSFTFTQPLEVGQSISGPGIASGTTITAVSGSTLTISKQTNAASTPGEVITAQSSYTILQLTAQSISSGSSVRQGQTVNIYEPFFASNTRYVLTNPSPMPSWLAASFNPNETPGQMVFGCDSVFASNGIDPDSVAAVGDIENSIVSAFNRGLAANFNIPPDNWAGFPNMTTPALVAADAQSKVAALVTYFYEVTALNALGESTPSLELSATLNPGQSATLNWGNGSAFLGQATGYRIYRGTSQHNLTLLATTQQTSYTDEGGATQSNQAPQFMFFAPGTNSNWYADYVQTNSNLDPVAGVSINGLSYGFPYSDQGGVSTNLFFSPPNIPNLITVNLGELQAPGFVTQSLPDALINTPYQQTIIASGSGTGTTFQVTGSTLPSWLGLNATSGVLSGTAPGSPATYSFIIQATNSAGSTAQPFRLNVDATVPSAPLSVPGVSGGNLSLPGAEVGQPYTATIHVFNGVAPYTLTANALPGGLIWQGGGVVSAASIDNGGSGYSTAPTVTISGGGGSGAMAIANLANGTVTSLTITNPGLGYTSPPAVTFTSNGGGAGAAATAVLSEISATGVYTIAGTPTGANSNYGFNITIADSSSLSTTFTAHIVINPPLAIETLSLPTAGLNQPYTQTISTNETNVTAQLAVMSGTLPPGLALSTSGVLSGTPTTTAGSPFSFTVTATDSFGVKASQQYSLAVAQLSALQITTTTLPPAVPGVNYNQTIAATGGSTPYTFAIVNGSLPTGLNLDLATGALTGIPTATMTASFTVRVADAIGDTAYQGYTLALLAVSPGTSSLATNATTLTIAGTGFDPNPSNDSVAFTVAHGTLTGIVTTATPTQLTVTLTPANLAPGDAVNAVVTADGDASGPPPGTQVATVVAAASPIITRNTSSLAVNATTLTIAGSGFDMTAVNNSVMFTVAHGALTGVITSASPTQLVVTVKGSGLAVGDAINATVITDGVTSSAAQVATLAAGSTPSIDFNTNILFNNVSSIVINGTGFDTSNGGTNLVTLAEPSGTPVTVTSVTANSPYQLTVGVTGLSSGISGLVNAAVTVDGIPAPVPANQNGVTVASIQGGAPPQILLTGIPSLAANATSLTIYGYGYTAASTVALTGDYGTGPVLVATTNGPTYTTHVVSPNQITLTNLSIPQSVPQVSLTSVGSGYQSPPTVTFVGGGATVQATGTAVMGSGASAGQVINVMITSTGSGYTSAPTVMFTGGNPTNAAAGTVALSGLIGTNNLQAKVTDPVNGASPNVTVATIQSSSRTAPTVTQGQLSNLTLTLTGTGFDTAAVATNLVTLYAGSTQLPPAAIAPLISGTGPNVVANSSTQLTVTLAGPLPAGIISASVATDGVPMTGSPVQITSSAGSAPTLTSSTTKLSVSPTNVTITGAGFAAANGSTNTVVLYTGTAPNLAALPPGIVESVVAISGTQLTAVLDTATPLPAGPLSAVVTSNGISSGSPVQVATIVSGGPTITFNAGSLPAAAQKLTISGTGFDPNSANDLVTISTVAGPIANAVASVSANANGTQLNVTLSMNSLPVGQLYATVTTTGSNAATSNEVQVATVGPGFINPPNSVTLTVNGEAVTLNSPAGTTLVAQAVSNPSPADAPVGISFPAGFFTLQVENIVPGGAISVVITLPPDLTPDVYFRYGATPGRPSPHWYDFSFDGTTGAVIQGNVISLHFVDGQRGDDDLLANGAIVDPGAPGIQQLVGDGQTPNQRFVAQLYEDLLSRPLDATGLVYFGNLLDQGTTRPQVVTALENSQEFLAHFIQQSYQQTLGRQATPAEVQAGLSFLQPGGSYAQFTAGLLATPEFYADHGGTNAGFLQGLYQVVLDRTPDQAGFQSLSQALANGASRLSIALSLVQGSESAALRVGARYQQLLHRPSDPAGLSSYVTLLQNGGSLTQVDAALGGSTEYFSDVNHVVDQAFVRQLYREFLEREADPAGLASWTGLLDQALLSPNQVAQAILNGRECETLVVQSAYFQYLGRSADPQGLQADLAFLAAGGTDEQVAALLTSSPEYYQDSGATTAGFLGALYQDALARPIDPAGQASLTLALANGATRAQVAAALFNSTEYRQDLVNSYYQQFLQRSAEPAELKAMVNLLAAGARNEQLIASLVSSAEFFGLV